MKVTTCSFQHDDSQVQMIAKVDVSKSSQFVSEMTEHVSESSQYISKLDISETTR